VKRTVNIIKKWFPYELGYFNLILSIILAIYLIQFLKKGLIPVTDLNLTVFLAIVYSFITLNLFAQFISAISSRSRLLTIFLSFLTIISFYVFMGYHFRINQGFNYEIAADNFREAFNAGGMDVIVQSIGKNRLILLAIVVVVIAFLEYKKKILSRNRQSKYLIPKVLVSGVLYFSLLLTPTSNYDDLRYFFSTMNDHYFKNSYKNVEYKEGTFPFIKEGKITKKERLTPNIFIIFMESFNANYAETRSEEGKEYTPFLNSMIPKGLYVENFYGNSIQTCKGHIAAFASIIPAFKGKIYRNYQNIKLETIQDILKENGYETIFMKAGSDVNFDNTYGFLTKHGFNFVGSIASYLRPEDKPHVSGWGVSDDVFYKRTFEFLDSYVSKLPADKPVFVSLATVTNHMNFNFLPKDQMHIYKNPRDIKQNYANTTYIADLFLKEFFKELEKRPRFKNSLVIILGDHSYPMGEHYICHTEVSAYNESFKVPYLMYWKGKIKPQRIKKYPYSQMDIAPTLIDMLGIKVKKHHFIGVSIFDKTKELHPIYLIQPYNGRFISVINYPYKYIFHMSSKVESVYDLENDPGEKKNIVSFIKKERPDIYANFQKELNFVYLDQVLIEKNAVWNDHN